MAAFQCGEAAFQVAVVVDGVLVLTAFQLGQSLLEVAVVIDGVLVLAAFQGGEPLLDCAVVVDGVFVLAAFQRGQPLLDCAVVVDGVLVLSAFQCGNAAFEVAVVVGCLALVSSRADDGGFGNGNADGLFVDFAAVACGHGRDARRDVQLAAQIGFDVLASDGAEVVFGGCVRDGGSQCGGKQQADDVAVNGQLGRDGCAVWEFDGHRKRQAVGLQRLACFAGQGDFE